MFLWYRGKFMTGKEFKKLRLAMGLSQSGLARELKYSANAVARLERDERKISHPVALAMLYLAEKKEREVADMSGGGVVAKLPWKKTTAKEYQDCPHEYVTRRLDRGPSGVRTDVFDTLAKRIKTHGVMRNWRGKRFKYFSSGGYVYWHMGFIINRSLEESLENDGWPSKKSQAKIQARFGTIAKGGK